MRKFGTVIVSLLLVNGSGLAHHSRANFDSATVIELTGTVVDYAWRNPHVYMQIEAPDAAGVTQTWLLEAHSVTGMRGNGWDENSLTPGEQITISGSPDRNPDKHFVLLNYLEKSNGERLYPFGNRGAPRPPAPAVAPSTNFSGTWNLDLSSFNIREAGGGPPADWSYTQRGAALAAQYDAEQNPELECLEIGVPRIVLYPYGINWVRTAESIRIHKEHLDEKRVIWLNEMAENMADQPPSYVGTSIGRFESDRHLVVETTNFLPTRWGSANGVDSSEQKSVVEHYRLTEDGLRIEFSFTITDPVYLAEPATMTGAFNKAQNRDFVETGCDTNAASRHLTVEP